MTQSEIVTQHFNDPIGSVMNIGGKCYVKVSNKTHTIDTPVSTDEYSVYFENAGDCENNRVTSGKLLCPPVGKLLFTVGDLHATVVMSFSISHISMPPTNPLYANKPLSITRSLARITMIHPQNYNHPSNDIDSQGNQRLKTALSRIVAKVAMNTGDLPGISVINKMLHK